MPAEMRWVPQLAETQADLPRVANIQGSGVYRRIKDELQPRYGKTVHFFDSIGPSGKVILTLTSSKASKGVALRHACNHLKIGLENVVTFGDAENDIIAGKAAGTRTIAVTWGYIIPGHDPYGWRADYTIDQPKELLNL